MALVNIDIVGLETAQAVVAGIHQVFAGKTFAIDARPHTPSSFGGNGKRASVFALHPAPHDFLRLAACVNVGGIEEVDAFLYCGVQNGEGGVILYPAAKVDPCSEANFRDPESRVSQRSIIHNNVLPYSEK